MGIPTLATRDPTESEISGTVLANLGDINYNARRLPTSPTNQESFTYQKYNALYFYIDIGHRNPYYPHSAAISSDSKEIKMNSISKLKSARAYLLANSSPDVQREKALEIFDNCIRMIVHSSKERQSYLRVVRKESIVCTRAIRDCQLDFIMAGGWFPSEQKRAIDSAIQAARHAFAAFPELR